VFGGRYSVWISLNEPLNPTMMKFPSFLGRSKKTPREFTWINTDSITEQNSTKCITFMLILIYKGEWMGVEEKGRERREE
jgi:hypothetical protein